MLRIVLKMIFWFISIAMVVVSLACQAQTLLANSPTSRSDVSRSIARGKSFVFEQVANNKNIIRCMSTDSRLPCPLDNQGQLFTYYFILDALNRDEIPVALANRVIRVIDDLNRNNRWAFSKIAPLGADCTSFALQMLLKLGRPLNVDGLKSFYDKSLGTYGAFNHPTARNVISAELIGNVFYLFQLADHRDQINYELVTGLQKPSGYWSGEYYPGVYYATYINARLLCRAGKGKRSTERALRYLANHQNADGSWGEPGDAFDTALAVNTMLECGNVSVSVSKGVGYLLKAQHQEGFWLNDRAVWQYHYPGRSGITWSVYDKNNIVTTALAIKALSHYKNSKYAY